MAKSRSALLEVIARYASQRNTIGVSELERQGAKRIQKWLLQDLSGELLPGERVAVCTKHMIPTRATVDILHTPKYKRANFRNLMVCGSVWTCPVCAARITERRNVEVQEVIDELPYPKGLVTFTLQHKKFETLEALYNGLNNAYRGMKVGRWWQLFERSFGIDISIRGTEITWGEGSGWHPHFHTLFFFNKPLVEIDQEKFISEIKNKFETEAGRNGFYVSPEFGVNVSFDQEQASAYVAKWGMSEELTKSPSKVARKGERFSPFQLLLQYALSGEKYLMYRDRFLEYAKFMKGKRQLVWSQGARKKLGMGEEPTDQELAEGQEEIAVLFAQLRNDQWKKVLRQGIRGELLEVAGLGDYHKLKVYLESLGITLE
jgi:hypothetical protein